MSVFAVLLDSMSIQQYIFVGNKVKQYLGASELVRQIYDKALDQSLETVFSKSVDTKTWHTDPAKIIGDDQPVAVIYIGGGKAMLIFREQEKAYDFIREWTKILLLEMPAMRPMVACEEINVDNFLKEKSELFELLEKNKSRYSTQTWLQGHGITAECPYSGMMREVWNADVKDYVSSVTHAKILAAHTAVAYWNKEYRRIIGADREFPVEFDELCATQGEDSHIAIVHIDGNDIGQLFINARTIEELRRFSMRLNEIFNTALRNLLGHIVAKEEWEQIQKVLGYEPTNKYMPLRPLVLGGDDITFVTDGRLGLYFAFFFIRELEKQKLPSGDSLSACAGVAVTKTKYPFYRGYQLCEELCSSAKQKRRQENDTGSWLDFHIAAGAFSGDLADIRTHYEASMGNLLVRPYKIGLSDDVTSFDLLVENASRLSDMPSRKLHALRQILTRDQKSCIDYVKALKSRGGQLPQIKGKVYHEKLFQDALTPYFDMIELLGCYPSHALKKRGGQA